MKIPASLKAKATKGNYVGETMFGVNHFVVGLIFSEDRQQVLLIEKNKPKYLEGKWNGPGGKVEPNDETIFHALRREFIEEVGIDLWNVSLQHIIHMTFYPTRESQPLHIDFICGFSDLIFTWRKMENEQPAVSKVDNLLGYRNGSKLVSNLHWMLPYAVDRYRTALIFCEEVQQ